LAATNSRQFYFIVNQPTIFISAKVADGRKLGFRSSIRLLKVIQKRMRQERNIVDEKVEGRKVKGKKGKRDIAVCKLTSPLREITYQCYQPAGRGDFPAFTPAEAGTQFSDPEGMQG